MWSVLIYDQLMILKFEPFFGRAFLHQKYLSPPPKNVPVPFFKVLFFDYFKRAKLFPVYFRDFVRALPTQPNDFHILKRVCVCGFHVINKTIITGEITFAKYQKC